MSDETTLYRAASHDNVRVGYSFATRRDDAEAYRDNPGFGGGTLYRCRLELADVVDLTSGWDALSEALGYEADPLRWQHFAAAITSDDDICEELAAAGYQWAQILDDYPDGCVTYVPLTSEAADAAESAMEEIDL